MTLGATGKFLNTAVSVSTPTNHSPTLTEALTLQLGTHHRVVVAVRIGIVVLLVPLVILLLLLLQCCGFRLRDILWRWKHVCLLVCQYQLQEPRGTTVPRGQASAAVTAELEWSLCLHSKSRFLEDGAGLPPRDPSDPG